MLGRSRRARINVKVLIILIVVTVGLGVALVVARQVRRDILSKMDFEAGTAAFEKGDWSTAYKHFEEYLGRHPDDIDILKKYAQARLSVRPLEPGHISGAMAAYRRVIQLDPSQEEPYKKLAMLNAGLGNFEELAYLARKRLEQEPNDFGATLWLSEALVKLNRTQEARETLAQLIQDLEADPEEHVEYVRACAQMSGIESSSNEGGATDRALEWLNKAVGRFPNSVEALAARARLYRLAPGLPDADTAERTQLAQRDLTEADEHGTNDPRIRLFLAREWMAYRQFDKARAELEAADGIEEATIQEHYFDLNTWIVDRFEVASELALRTGTFTEGVALVEAVLGQLEERGYRIRVLPNAIRLYVASGAERDVSMAAECLKEYETALYALQKAGQAKLELAYLRALVARAQGNSYAVIDALQPVVASGASYAELLQLLAEAFSRTDQPRRAVDAMVQYLRLRPGDPTMILRLTKEYLRLQDWSRAFEMARLGQSLSPADISLRLLRIEAGIYVAAEQEQSLDMARLAELNRELVELRKDEANAKRVDIRILQAIIGIYMAQAQTELEAREQKLAQVEEGLKQAIVECDEPLRAEMQLVRLYFQTKQMAKAIEECKAACDRHPEVAEPWLSLAGLEVSNGDPNSAIRCLEDAHEAVTGDWEKRAITIRRALLEIMHGDRAAGVDLLTELATSDPREIRARTLLLDIREVRENQARANELVEQLEAAEGESGLMWRLYRASTWLSGDQWRSKQQGIVDLLQYCIDADPQWVAPPLLLAQLYEKLGDHQRVEDVCREALVRNPSATAIADKLVTLLEDQDRLSDAEDIRQKVEADPRVASAWNVNAALRSGDFSRAIDELRLRISNDDRDVQSRVLLARLLYWQTRDVKEAMAYLDEAEAIASRSLATVGVRTAILKAEGRANEAQRILDEYVTSKDDFNAYLMRATYHVSQGQLDLAEADYKKLTTFKDTENRGIGYTLLSDFYDHQNRASEAIQVLEEGLQAYPDDLVLQRLLMKRLFMRAKGQDRERAMAMLEALEQKLPDDPDLMQVRATELLQTGDPQSVQTARSLLEEAVKLDTTATQAHLILIGLAMRSGDYETARECAIRAVGANPKNPALLSARGRAEAALGNTQIATQLAHLALAEDPNNAQALDVLVNVGAATGDEGLLNEAIESTRAISQTDPNRAEAFNAILARALASKNPTLLNEARRSIESELSKTPSNERLLLAHAEVLVILGSPADAIPELVAYCQSEQGSKSLDAVITLADLCRLAGDLDQAYKWIERAEQLAPKSQTVTHARLLCLLAQERFDDLAGISSLYIASPEQNPTLVVRAATILASMDSAILKQEGIKLFTYAAETWPTLPGARLGLASALYQSGDPEKAKQTYQALLTEFPNNVQVLNDLAWIIQEHDHDYEAALELANKGMALRGSNEDRRHLLDTRGTILSNLPDRLANARADFEELVSLTASDTPERARALLNLARVCAKLGDLEQAKRHIGEAMTIDAETRAFTPEQRAEAQSLLP